MDQSLDDIIKSRKISAGVTKKFIAKKSFGALNTSLNRKTTFKAPVIDARQKIIQRKRLKIRDARDRILEIKRRSGLDARQTLLRNKKLISETLRNGQANFRPGAAITRKVPLKAAAPVARPRPGSYAERIHVPRGYVDYDNMNSLEEEEYVRATQLSRTVTNEMAHYGPSTRSSSTGGNYQHHLDPMVDPFDLYDAPLAHIERRVSSTNLLPPPPKGILRSTNSRQHSPPPPRGLYERHYESSSASSIPSHLSYEMRTRLERAPDPHASMGIFANNHRNHSSASSPSLAAGSALPQGYRIVVSNLHTSVTQADVKELFEDIGSLYESRLVRPGVAEVIYKRLEDAEAAVETYHNRQLDGQPMKCLLVNPRASDKPTAPAIKVSSSSLGSRGGGSGERGSSSASKSSLEVDIDTLHKVLFRR